MPLSLVGDLLLGSKSNLLNFSRLQSFSPRFVQNAPESLIVQLGWLTQWHHCSTDLCNAQDKKLGWTGRAPLLLESVLYLCRLTWLHSLLLSSTLPTCVRAPCSQSASFSVRCQKRAKLLECLWETVGRNGGGRWVLSGSGLSMSA